jgi:hypothetical protein
MCRYKLYRDFKTDIWARLFKTLDKAIHWRNHLWGNTVDNFCPLDKLCHLFPKRRNFILEIE